MELALKVLAYSFCGIALAWAVFDQAKSCIESRKRRQLEAEIRAIADDLATDPDSLSLSDAMILLPLDMIRELVVELRKMPEGSRRLQRAIQITGDENYGRKPN